MTLSTSLLQIFLPGRMEGLKRLSGKVLFQRKDVRKSQIILINDINSVLTLENDLTHKFNTHSLLVKVMNNFGYIKVMIQFVNPLGFVVKAGI